MKQMRPVLINENVIFIFVIVAIATDMVALLDDCDMVPFRGELFCKSTSG
jgi:hypothetical protein